MTAIHAGHELRPELADVVLVDASTRRREEDPFTDRLAVAGGQRRDVGMDIGALAAGRS